MGKHGAHPLPDTRPRNTMTYAGNIMHTGIFLSFSAGATSNIDASTQKKHVADEDLIQQTFFRCDDVNNTVLNRRRRKLRATMINRDVWGGHPIKINRHC